MIPPHLDVFRDKSKHPLAIKRPPVDMAGRVYYLRLMVTGLLENGCAEVQMCSRQGEIVATETFVIPVEQLIAGPVVKMEMEAKQ